MLVAGRPLRLEAVTKLVASAESGLGFNPPSLFRHCRAGLSDPAALRLEHQNFFFDLENVVRSIGISRFRDTAKPIFLSECSSRPVIRAGTVKNRTVEEPTSHFPPGLGHRPLPVFLGQE